MTVGAFSLWQLAHFRCDSWRIFVVTVGAFSLWQLAHFHCGSWRKSIGAERDKDLIISRTHTRTRAHAGAHAMSKKSTTRPPIPLNQQRNSDLMDGRWLYPDAFRPPFDHQLTNNRPSECFCNERKMLWYGGFSWQTTWLLRDCKAGHTPVAPHCCLVFGVDITLQRVLPTDGGTTTKKTTNH